MDDVVCCRIFFSYCIATVSSVELKVRDLSPKGAAAIAFTDANGCSWSFVFSLKSVAKLCMMHDVCPKCFFCVLQKYTKGG